MKKEKIRDKAFSARKKLSEKSHRYRQKIKKKRSNTLDLDKKDLKRPLSVTLFTALIVFAVAFTALSGMQDENTPETHVVEFTDRGFDPVTLEIEKGDTVRFVDNASITMWVASDTHPTHRDYSNTTMTEHCGNDSIQSFDQCSTGPEYEFTFEKTGDWTYHNHEPFASGGEIKVTE
ncbi:MAG: hypothetical protein R6V22_07005 [Rhodohalobacter sp.]|uniref:cupredoxin domain-containing protein n=1 Tax=Rhodohalobacter sp. TaxID=1974210 RepID=UPI003976AFB6